MYLSRLILNPRSRQVQRELADPYEMHRTICRAFPDANFKENEPSGILFRLDLHPKKSVPTLLVQSHFQPDWSFLLADRKDYLLGEAFLPLDVENPAWKEISLQLREGQALAFRLRANPTFKKTMEKDGGEKHKMRLGIFKEEDQHDWLKRKLEVAGAALVYVNISNSQLTRGKLFIEKEDEKRMRFLAVQFEGLLKVKDPNRLLESVRSGIGSGKGLGFGLLSLAPAR
jgi:CRISPR system Cascade subunit CasE